MRTLKQQVELLTDLKRHREIMAFRYYTSNDQSTLLDLITDEIESWPETIEFSEKIYIKLSNPERLALDSIQDLCLLYRQVILLKENPNKGNRRN